MREWLPYKQDFKRVLRYEQLRRVYLTRRLRKQMESARSLRVVIGAGETKFDGWFITDENLLDITSPKDWRNLFEPESIDRLLTEHVLEHLSESECEIALRECYRYLKRGGLLRIAVPDGYRTDEKYLASVTPPQDGHKVLFNVDRLSALLESVGFQAVPLEYFDRQGEFHAEAWDEADGFVYRSARFDRREEFRLGKLFYTSLIMDGLKR